MASRLRNYTPLSHQDKETHPFMNAEQAWFWFIAAQNAKNEGARFSAGESDNPRPCEPLDVLKVLDKLYRQRQLLMDHVQVLRHYGRRLCPPDARRPKEVRASYLWGEAMDSMEAVMVRKGIVMQRPPRHSNWHEQADIFSGVTR